MIQIKENIFININQVSSIVLNESVHSSKATKVVHSIYMANGMCYSLDATEENMKLINTILGKN